MDITGAECMIGNSNLQFTNASQLNDPFDCHPKLIDYSNIPTHNHQGGIPDEWWKTKRENDAFNKRNSTWLCSLSKVNDSILMWSHYCYNHKGVCIGLDLDKVMESVPPMFDVMYIKPLVLDVQYKDIIERPNAYRDTCTRGQEPCAQELSLHKVRTISIETGHHLRQCHTRMLCICAHARLYSSLDGY